ncbi:Tudor domain, partial [Trinorchestia longiramus]
RVRVAELHVGTYWAVLDRDRRCWCRAQVLKNCLPSATHCTAMESRIEFQLVDYGIVVNVWLQDVCVLDERFTLCPPYAVHSALAKLSPPAEDAFRGWSEESCRAVLAMCKGQEILTAYFVP